MQRSAPHIYEISISVVLALGRSVNRTFMNVVEILAELNENRINLSLLERILVLTITPYLSRRTIFRSRVNLCQMYQTWRLILGQLLPTTLNDIN